MEISLLKALRIPMKHILGRSGKSEFSQAFSTVGHVNSFKSDDKSIFSLECQCPMSHTLALALTQQCFIQLYKFIVSHKGIK